MFALGLLSACCLLLVVVWYWFDDWLLLDGCDGLGLLWWVACVSGCILFRLWLPAAVYLIVLIILILFKLKCCVCVKFIIGCKFVVIAW